MSVTFNPTPGPAAAGTGAVASKSAANDQTVFLQLLVTELKNQDPMNPVQGTDFVTQLAQFQQLQQSITSGEDVSAIHTDLDQLGTALVNSINSGSTSQT